jgi:Tfp pilus assembly protein FimT
MHKPSSPFRRRTRSGASLLELATALALLAVGLSAALPPAAGLRDRLAVGAVRNEMLALLLRARAEAPARGGARLEIRVGDDEVRLFSGDSMVALHRFRRAQGVGVELGGGRDEADIVYDALGLGRVASRTVVIARGRMRDTIRISSYGRVAR